MTLVLNEILKALKITYSNIKFLESTDKTTGRYREKHVIVFEYTNIAGDRCVLKYFSLQHIEEEQKYRERDELLEEFRTIKKFGNTPHVVQVYDANELRLDGRLIGLYITMEKFDTTLADLINSNRMVKPSLVDDFLRQMDQILFMAHYQLNEPVIHSDIKPGNIGVRTLPGGKLQYALMDFDISVVLKKVADGTLMLSNKASIRGITPAYAPPEQVIAYLHNSGNISNRVDIYAIGAIAMQMLTGLAPEKDTSKIYYQLPFDKLTSKWKPIFFHLCNPDPSKRPKRIADAFKMPEIHDPSDGTVTIKIKPSPTRVGNPFSIKKEYYGYIVDKINIITNTNYNRLHNRLIYTALSIVIVAILIYSGFSLFNSTNTMGSNDNSTLSESSGITNPNTITESSSNPSVPSRSFEALSRNSVESTQNRISNNNVGSSNTPDTPSATSQPTRSSSAKGSISVIISPSSASVLIRSSDGRVVAQTTGSANVNNIDYGDYIVRVSATGFVTTFEEIKVYETDLIQRRITLKEAPNTNQQQVSVEPPVSPSIDCGGDVRDSDGNRYSAVLIGQQCWMGSNLRVSKYRDGSIIPRISNDNYWAGSTTGAWSYYENSSSNESSHGVLYNWYAVVDNRGLCPVGWRVPSPSDWSTLANSLSNNPGGKLKATRSWRSPNVGADNSSQFNAMPSGTRSSSGSFADLGTSTGYWTSNQASESSATLRYLTYNMSTISSLNQPKNSGYSVRCVKN